MIRDGEYDETDDLLVPALQYELDKADDDGEVSWTGNIYIKESGDYTFQFQTNDSEFVFYSIDDSHNITLGTEGQ